MKRKRPSKPKTRTTGRTVKAGGPRKKAPRKKRAPRTRGAY